MFENIPALQNLGEKLGVRQETIRRAPLAGITDLWEPWTPAQQTAAQKWVDDFYDAFIEDVAEVRVCLRGPDLRAGHVGQRAVGPGRHGVVIDRLGERRPARAGVELVARREERFTRDDIHIDAILVTVPVFVLERRLGPLVLGDAILHRIEAATEFFVGGLLKRHGTLRG